MWEKSDMTGVMTVAGDTTAVDASSPSPVPKARSERAAVEME